MGLTEMTACAGLALPVCLSEFDFKENVMWYFAWVLGIGFAVLLAILNAMWGENEAARADARRGVER